jgi:hypothetical protein
MENYFTAIDTADSYTDVELNFLKRLEGAELFFDSEILDNLVIKKSLKTNHIDNLTASISSLNISTSVNIDNLTGNEEDLEEWFANFERISTSAGWTADIKGIKLPTYLRESALLVWESLKAVDKADYEAIKKEIVKMLKSTESLEDSFYRRKQKSSESVVDFALKLTKLGRKALSKLSEGDQDAEILKRFKENLIPDLRKMLVSTEPSDLATATNLARKAEKILTEEGEEKKICTINSIKVKSRENSSESQQFSSRRPDGYNRGHQLADTEDKNSRKSRNDMNYKQYPQRSRSNSSNYRREYKTYNEGRRSTTPYNEERAQARETRNIICYHCNRKGHYSNECRSNKGDKSENVSYLPTCYRCGKRGHVQRDCQLNSKN